MKIKLLIVLAIALHGLSTPVDSAFAQGTAFTYQGQLGSGGVPANGNYDFTFALFSGSTTNTSQIGATLIQTNVGVTNGLFIVTLDFGANFPGASRWLGIGARSNGAVNFTALNPLQEVTPTPYAIYTANAGNAATATTASTAESVEAADISGTIQPAQLPSNVVTNTEMNTTLGGAFGGDGSNLTNLDAAQLSSGVVPNGVLPGFQASSNYSTVNGGQSNMVTSDWATVGGGLANQATNAYATVPGGASNVASGSYSFAAGLNAHATNQGAFVWADSQPGSFSSTNTNSFNVRAGGGVVFNTGGVGIAVDGASVLTATSNAIQEYEINDGGNSAYQTLQQAVQAVGGDTSLSFSNIYQVTVTSGSPSFTLSINGSPFGSVIGFTGTDGMSQPYTYVVETQTTSATANPNSELGLPASLTFSRNGRSTVFGGIVTACALASSTTSNFLYSVKLESGLAYLALNTGYQLNQNITAPNEATAVFQNDSPFMAVATSLSATYQAHGTLTEYAETDLNFFSRILENEGVFYFFNQSANPPSLILGDSTASYLASPNSPFIYYGNTASIIPAGAEYIRTFQQAVHQSTLASTVTAYDPTLGSSGSATSNATGGVGAHLEFGNAVNLPAYNQQLAGVRAGLQSAQRAAIAGTATAPDLRAGYTFGLTDSSGAGLGGSYLVTSIHQAGFVRVTNGASTYFYGNEFEAVPSSLIFRPALRTPKPQALPCLATVTGPSGDEIYVDNYGRVQVSFTWEGGKDTNSTGWVPVASPWAGAGGRGIIFNPRIGDEVLVSFIQGDPDQPIVSGSLYNSSAMPPFTLPLNKTQSGIVTLSSLGGGGFNELRFEDLKDSEEIFLHAQKNFTVDVLNNMSLTVSAARTESVGGNSSEMVSGTKTVTVNENSSETVSGAKSVVVGGSSSENVGGSKTVTATGNISLASSSQIALNSPVNITGATSVSNTLTVTSNLSASVSETGGLSSAAATIQNLNTSANCSPALRVVAQGSPVYGTLSVSTGGPVSSTNTNPIASFGNSVLFVSYLDNNGNWYARGSFTANAFISLSDRNAKENFRPISAREVLDKVAALPLSRWNYKEDKTSAHMGPMAQDFRAAFDLGNDDKHIATVDEEGVALAAIQGLNQKLNEKDGEIQTLKQQNDSLTQRLNELEATVKQLVPQKGSGQ
ncbi:MAG: type VI secretion system tip protein TssI/VgrG [Verrucomicrobiota bacterium]|jgi:type VI secretion system secreted protein VgrG